MASGSKQVALAVECHSVSKDFGAGETVVHALRGADLEVRQAEMTLLVGPSGCGKTTLISIIAGLLNPTSGSVAVLGQDLSQLDSNALCDFRAQNIGFVFQQYHLLPALTAAENAAIPLVLLGESLARAADKARDSLAAVGLADRWSALPNQLSGGQQQRVAIARALVHNPKLLVCDEPTSALDSDAGQQIMQLFRDVAVQPGRGVLVVTHDSRVFTWGDRIAQMQDGRVTTVTAPSATPTRPDPAPTDPARSDPPPADPPPADPSPADPPPTDPPPTETRNA